MRERRAPRPARRPAAATAPLDDAEIEALQGLLAAVPPPLEPLDVSALDGFLCGVLVQPEPVAPARWLPFVTDIDGRPLPPNVDVRPLHALVRRREHELRQAIERRNWFDPWVFDADVDVDATGDGDADGDADADADRAPAVAAEGDIGRAPAAATGGDAGRGPAAAAAAVVPWAAGFTAALESFPALLGADDAALTTPLALVYRHVGTDTLDDAEALRDEIDALEPPADLGQAVEELVRATLLLADVAGLPTRR